MLEALPIRIGYAAFAGYVLPSPVAIASPAEFVIRASTGEPHELQHRSSSSKPYVHLTCPS
jgi:hypothetical protein